jgi:hypothetical protein
MAPLPEEAIFNQNQAAAEKRRAAERIEAMWPRGG